MLEYCFGEFISNISQFSVTTNACGINKQNKVKQTSKKKKKLCGSDWTPHDSDQTNT